MRLITAHRILVGAGIAFFVFYAIVQVKLYRETGTTVTLLQAVVSLAIAAAFALYYRSLARWGTKR